MDIFLLIPGHGQGPQTEKEQPGEGAAKGRGELTSWPPRSKHSSVSCPVGRGPTESPSGKLLSQSPWILLAAFSAGEGWKGLTLGLGSPPRSP